MPHGNKTSQSSHESVVLVTGVVALGLFAAPLMKTFTNAVFNWWSEPFSTQAEIAKKLKTANQLYTELHTTSTEWIAAANYQKWQKELEDMAPHQSYTAQDENRLDQLLKEMSSMRITVKLQLLERELSSFEQDINHLERDGYWLTRTMRIELQEARRPLHEWKKELNLLKKLEELSEIQEKDIEVLRRKITAVQEEKLKPIKVTLAPQCISILFGRMPVPSMLSESQEVPRLA